MAVCALLALMLVRSLPMFTCKKKKKKRYAIIELPVLEKKKKV